MRKRRFINIVVAPEDRSGTLTVRIQVGHFYALAVFLSLAFVGTVVLVMNQAMDEAKLGELEFLRHQNGDLHRKVARIAAVERKLTELEVIEDKLMVMAGERTATRELAPVSVEAGQPGAGGKATTPAEGLTQFRTLFASRRGIALAGPSGYPVANGWVARGFGETGLEGAAFHTGVDVAVPAGTPVTATASGVVTFAGDDPVYGKLVIIQHGLTGYATFYGHNRELKVRTGAQVNRGDVIAFAGNTGKSTAPHLHYEVRLHGVPVNAAKYFPAVETGGEVEAALAAPAAAETAEKPAAGTALIEPPAIPAEKKAPTAEAGSKSPGP
jgi:murein DD-endopeptidase MepM/ murein hydrolase activator NlpD